MIIDQGKPFIVPDPNAGVLKIDDFELYITRECIISASFLVRSFDFLCQELSYWFYDALFSNNSLKWTKVSFLRSYATSSELFILSGPLLCNVKKEEQMQISVLYSEMKRDKQRASPLFYYHRHIVIAFFAFRRFKRINAERTACIR